MRRFKCILLYASRGSSSRVAFRRAEALAAENQALLYVIDVLPVPEEPRWTARGILLSRQVDVTTRLEELRTLVAPALGRGVAVEVEVLVGRPFTEIIRAVSRRGHDLVVLDADGREGHPGDPLRRTTMDLLRACPCAVWAIKGTERGPYRRVLAAVDGGEDWSRGQRESRRVLELAKSVAESAGCELRIVYGMGHWTSDYSVRWPDSPEDRVDRLLASCNLSRENHHVHFESSPVVDVVATLCAEVDVLVLGTVWRSGLAGALVADAAKDALARVDCSVLAVKPEGLIPPPWFSRRPISREKGARSWAA